MPTNIYCHNDLIDDLQISTRVSPGLSRDYWSDPQAAVELPAGGPRARLYWIDREEGISDGDTWVVSSSLVVGGSNVRLQLQLVGTLVASIVSLQIGCGEIWTGWSSSDTQLRFTAADGRIYKVFARFVSTLGIFDDVVFGVHELRDAILPQIDHVVVLMMENRSLDNLLGWIHPPGSPPKQVLGEDQSPDYNGLSTTLSNEDPRVGTVNVSEGTSEWNVLTPYPVISEWCVPSPDPGEEFEHVALQLSGKMQGFLTDYVNVTLEAEAPAGQAKQIMQSYSVAQLPVISTLATSFAVSDQWFASVPSQTWPNRGFLQTGSSDAHVNNDDYEPWDIDTVFDVFGANDLPWSVYNDGWLPSLTKTMFLDKYFDNATNFRGIGDFYSACAAPASTPLNQKLPAFSFVEPNFGVWGNDQSYHPPHSVCPGEQFLKDVYDAIRASPYRDNILFMVLFDEHGGTYDHVEPPKGAAAPKPGAVASNGFRFDQFGVRIPAIVVSSWVTPGTVFRSDIAMPIDHTSMLATLRDWQGLSEAFRRHLPSPRIVAAPNLAYVLTETTAQVWPDLPSPACDMADVREADDGEPLNGVQKSVLLAAAQLAAGRPRMPMKAQAARLRLETHGDGRRLVRSLEPRLPIR